MFLTMYPLRSYVSRNTQANDKDVLDVVISTNPNGPQKTLKAETDAVLTIQTSFTSKAEVRAVIRLGIYNNEEDELRLIDTKLTFGHSYDILVARMQIPTLRLRNEEYRVDILVFEGEELVVEKENMEVQPLNR